MPENVQVGLEEFNGLDSSQMEVELLSSDQSLCWAVLRLSRYVEHALAEFNLTTRQYHVLVTIAHGPLSPTQLAQRSNVSGPSATMMLRGLIDRGLVKRFASTTDQRRIWVTLTTAGRDLLVEANSRVHSLLAEIADHFSGRTTGSKALESLVSWNFALDRFRPGWLATHSQLATQPGPPQDS